MTEGYPTEEEMRAALVERATTYCTLTGTRMSALEKILGRGKGSFRQIENGRNFTVKTYTEVMTWLEVHWPRQPVEKPSEMVRQG